MSDLVNFAKQVEQQLKDANREPHWSRDEADQYMADVADRRERFEQTSSQLCDTVVQPRLETLGGYFANASLTKRKSAAHYSCYFGYCERFPASTTVTFAIEHDATYEKLVVRYEVRMMPLFIKLDEHDKLTLPLDDISEDVVATWVEQRLLEFLDSYLRIDRGGENLDEEVVVDPVCGMRIGRSSAAATKVYYGHPYFFCSVDCRGKFAAEPTSYVQVKTM